MVKANYNEAETILQSIPSKVQPKYGVYFNIWFINVALLSIVVITFDKTKEYYITKDDDFLDCHIDQREIASQNVLHINNNMQDT